MTNTVIAGFQAGITCEFGTASAELYVWFIGGPSGDFYSYDPGDWNVSNFLTSASCPYEGTGTPAAINAIITIPRTATPGNYIVVLSVNNTDYPHGTPYENVLYVWNGTLVSTVGLGPPDPGGGCST